MTQRIIETWTRLTQWTRHENQTHKFKFLLLTVCDRRCDLAAPQCTECTKSHGRRGFSLDAEELTPALPQTPSWWQWWEGVHHPSVLRGRASPVALQNYWCPPTLKYLPPRHCVETRQINLGCIWYNQSQLLHRLQNKFGPFHWGWWNYAQRWTRVNFFGPDPTRPTQILTQPDPTRVLELTSDPWPDPTRPKASMTVSNFRIF